MAFWYNIFLKSLFLLYIAGKKNPDNLESTMENSYLTFWFAKYGLILTTNKYYEFIATFMCSVMEEKCNLRSPISKKQNRIYRNV